MTFRGVFVALLELAFIVFALGTEYKQFLAMAFCLGALILYSVFSLFLATLTVGIIADINKRTVLRGERAKYKFNLIGTALLPVAFYLSINTADSKLNGKNKLKHSLVLVPTFSLEHKFVFELPCNHVGLWDIGINKIRCEDIFGLFSISLLGMSKSQFIIKLAVMPNTHDLIVNQEKNNSGGFGSTSIANAEEGELLGDSRLYRQGDTLKRINWKLSTRTKTLYSRQYETPQKPEVAIVLDAGMIDSTRGELSDIACESAISLVKYFIDNNNLISVVTIRNKEDNGNEIFNLKSHKDISKMQYDLSCVGFYTNSEPLRLAGIDDISFLKADKIYFITTNPSEELTKDFAELNKNNKSVVCIVPREASLGDYFEFESKLPNNARVDITSIAHIEEKIGEVV